MNTQPVQSARGLGIVLSAVTVVAACSAGGAGAVSCSMPVPQTQAGAGSTARVPIGQLPDIDADAVLAHTKKLSSDEFEGRAPGTKGEELTVRYLVDEFKKIGLKPGNTDGTYMQKVPL